MLTKCAQNESLKSPLTCKVKVNIIESEIFQAKHGEAVWGYEEGAWESAICDCCTRSGSWAKAKQGLHVTRGWNSASLTYCCCICTVHTRGRCRMPTCVRNMTVIPLFGDFFLRERQDWQKLRQHDCPSLTPISDAADSQTPRWLSTLLHHIARCKEERARKTISRFWTHCVERHCILLQTCKCFWNSTKCSGTICLNGLCLKPPDWSIQASYCFSLAKLPAIQPFGDD